LVGYFCSSSIEADVMTIHMTAFCCAVVGFLIMLVFASDSHRWTLYSTKLSPKLLCRQDYNNAPLCYTYSTHDEAKLAQFSFSHPYFFSDFQDEVKQWMLNLKVTDELFKGGDVPRGVGNLKGQSFATAFAKIKCNYSYFNDKEGDELICKHLDALLIKVENLKEGIQRNRTSNNLCPELQASTPEALGSDLDKDEEIAALKKELRDKNAALENCKAALEERDRFIATLKERLTEDTSLNNENIHNP